jgi:hypothetical protein
MPDEPFQFCSWDSEPALYRPGEAYVFRNGRWLNAPSMDVAMKAAVLSKQSFESLFPEAFPLPNNSSQFDPSFYERSR